MNGSDENSRQQITTLEWITTKKLTKNKKEKKKKQSV